MASCRDLKCDLEKTLESWLKIHEMMAADIKELGHYIAVHFEILLTEPDAIIQGFKDTLGWKEIEFVDNSKQPPIRPNYGTVMADSKAMLLKKRKNQKAYSHIHSHRSLLVDDSSKQQKSEESSWGWLFGKKQQQKYVLLYRQIYL